MNGRDKKSTITSQDIDIENDVIKPSQLSKLILLSIAYLQTSIIKIKDEISNDNNIKKADKEIIQNLLMFFDNVNNQVEEPHLKLQLTQQAIINAYYAIRRMESRSMLFFKDTSAVGNKLEKLASEDLKVRGSLIMVPHEVKPEMNATNFLTSSHSASNIRNALLFIAPIPTDEKTIHEELLLKYALINFSNESSEMKQTETAELLVKYRNILQAKNTKASNQLADRLQKALDVNFSSFNKESESPKSGDNKSPSMKSD